MKYAIHTNRSGATMLVAGENPLGVRGGTSGEWVSGEVVAKGQAVQDVMHLPPQMAIDLARALGRPVTGYDKVIRRICRERTELEVAVLIVELAKRGKPSPKPTAAQRLAQQSRAEEQRAVMNGILGLVEEFRVLDDAISFRGKKYAAKIIPNGNVQISREFIAALREAGVSGQALGAAYSAAQKIFHTKRNEK